MLKICGSSIYGPPELIFKEALSTGLFPSNLKKGNIVPIHKKGHSFIHSFIYFHLISKKSTSIDLKKNKRKKCNNYF